MIAIACMLVKIHKVEIRRFLDLWCGRMCGGRPCNNSRNKNLFDSLVFAQHVNGRNCKV